MTNNSHRSSNYGMCLSAKLAKLVVFILLVTWCLVTGVPALFAAVYSTCEVLEVDTCTSAWLIKRFVDPGAEFKFFPKGAIITEGIPFDTPDAEIRRIQNFSATEMIIKKYGISDKKAEKISEIVHALEINYWANDNMEYRKFGDDISAFIDSSESPGTCLEKVFAYIDQYAAGTPTMPKADYVDSADVKQWMTDGKKVVFIDVREPDEFQRGHIADAVNVPYREVERRVSEFQKDKTYVFYCTRSAWRSPYTANVFRDSGIKESYILSGGIAAWHAGREVIISSNPNDSPVIVPYAKDLPKEFIHPKDMEYDGSLELTLQDLETYDGLNGRPAFIAVDGIIYDVTNSRLWRGGLHDPSAGEVTAGRDLTEMLKNLPMAKKISKNFLWLGKL